MRLISVPSVAVLTLALLALGVGPCGDSESERPEPSEVLERSAMAAEQAGDFVVTYEMETRVAGVSTTTTGEVAESWDRVYHWTTEVEGGSPLGDQFHAEYLFLPPDLYMLYEDQWYIQTPWNQGARELEDSAVDPNKQLVKYPDIVRALTAIDERADEEIDGDTYWHYEGEVPWDEFPHETAFSFVGLEFDEAEDVDVDVWIDPETDLPLRMDLVLRLGDGLVRTLADISFEFSDWENTPSMPERPNDTRPMRDLEMPNAACSGEEYEGCFAAQTELEAGSVGACEGASVCFAPLGMVDAQIVRGLVAYYGETYGLEVQVLTPLAIPAGTGHSKRQQIDASTLVSYVDTAHRAGPEATIIALTPIDLYNQETHYRYIFGLQWSPLTKSGIVSTFRMDDAAYGFPPDDGAYHARVRKMVTKYIGVMHYGLATSGDPTSPLYDGIGGPGDLDGMSEPLVLEAGS